MKIKTCLIVILVFALLAIASGCDQPQVEDEGGQDIQTGDVSSGEEDDDEPTEFTEFGSSGSSGEGASEETEEESGSDVCDATNCAAPSVCYEGRCAASECMSDADCVNDDPCRPDVCMFAGHPNAFCSTEIIKKPRNGDGCCPTGAEIDTDTDCSPVCGNHKCEVDENAANCAPDCEHAGSSGGSAPSGGGPTSPY